MASTTVQQLRNDLEECKAEVGKMNEIVSNINTAISKAEALKIESDTMTHLREQKAQLVKDIENYKHMLQEAEDLKKSWDKNDTAMQTIDHDRQFQDGANRFEIHVSNLENMDKKLISPAKAEHDRIAFRRMESDGVINDLPIVFEFGLLARHQMGGWEVTEDQKKDDYFSFTFRWDEENAKGQEQDLEALRIKATSIVILYDEATNSIVNFDVEPGFEHQWGYGRQRFLQQAVLRKNSKAVFAKAILKDWSEQHEYELGKLTISLLKDSKNQRSDTLELVKLITQMAEKEQVWQEQKIEAEKNTIRLESQVNQLTAERDTLKLQLASLETQLSAVKTELETMQELSFSQIKAPSDMSGADTGSNQIQPDLQKKIDKLTDELEALKAAKDAEAKDLQDKIDALTQQLADKDAELKEANDKIAELENKIKTLESQVDTLTAQVDDLTKKLADSVASKQKLSDVLDIVEKNVATLTVLVEDLKKENEALKADLDAAKKAAEESEKAAAAAAAEKAKLEEKVSSLEKDVANLEGIAYRYCEDAKATKDQYNDAAKQLADAKAAQDAQKLEIQKAIDILQACLAQPDIAVPAAIENNVDCTEYRDSAPIVPPQPKEPVPDPTPEPEKPEPEQEKAPEPEPEKPPVEEKKQEAAAETSSSSSSSSSDSSSDESVVNNGYSEPPVEDDVIIAEKEEDMIIAEKVKDAPKPQFFPPKEEPALKPVKEEPALKPVKEEPAQKGGQSKKGGQSQKQAPASPTTPKEKEIPLDRQSMSSVGSKKKEKKLNPVLRALGCFGKNSWGKDESTVKTDK